jgi:hypothetical protein
MIEKAPITQLSKTSHQLSAWSVGWFVLREEYCWLASCWWLVWSERKVLLAGG